MTCAGESIQPPSASRGALRELLAYDGWAALGIALATVAVGLGTYGLGRAAGTSQLRASLATLGVVTLWVAVVSPIAAAGGSSSWGALLRGGIVADSSAITLIVLWVLARGANGKPYVTFIAAVKIYCTYAAMVLAGVAGVLCAKKALGKYVLGVLVALLMLAALASPLWIGGLLAAFSPETTRTIVAWVVFANPFYSVTSAVAEQMHFVWHYDAAMLYRISRIGQDVVPPPVPWYAAAWRYAAVAGGLSLIALCRRCSRRT